MQHAQRPPYCPGRFTARRVGALPSTLDPSGAAAAATELSRFGCPRFLVLAAAGLAKGPAGGDDRLPAGGEVEGADWSWEPAGGPERGLVCRLECVGGGWLELGGELAGGGGGLAALNPPAARLHQMQVASQAQLFDRCCCLRFVFSCSVLCGVSVCPECRPACLFVSVLCVGAHVCVCFCVWFLFLFAWGGGWGGGHMLLGTLLTNSATVGATGGAGCASCCPGARQHHRYALDTWFSGE